MKKSISIFVLLFCLLTVKSGTKIQIKDDYITKRLEYFSPCLNNFPPNIKDSLEYLKIQSQVRNLIDTLKKIEPQIANKLQYYKWMAKAYRYAWNLSEEGAWQECLDFTQKILELSPDSSNIKIELSGLYFNSFNPADSNVYERMNKGFSYLEEVYKGGKDTVNPGLYWNRFMYGKIFRADALCYDAIFKYKRYFPNDTLIDSIEELMDSTKSNIICMSLMNNIITYENNKFKYKVQYPVELLMYMENSNNSNEDEVSRLMLETPPILNKDSIPVRNAIIVSVMQNSEISLTEYKNRYFSKAGLINDGERLFHGLKNAKSYYYSTRYGQSDEYKGIFTILQTEKQLIICVFSATSSTYYKNLKYFEDFEKSFVFLK